MKTRRQHASEDALTITRSRTRSSTSIDNSLTIPIDLVIEIFLRLPAKSIATCRCVCKCWASMLRRADFTELFLTMSRARPQILFSCRTNSELYFFSTPQVRNSGLITATYHMKLPYDLSYKLISPVGGLVCLTHGRKHSRTAAVVCNPSTGQSLPLPNVKTRSVRVHSFLGFDPIDKQLKLLSMSSDYYGKCKEHQVLTLGSRKLSWRMIECSISHIYRGNDGICINGVLYYGAKYLNEIGHEIGHIVCFDVRSEKFSSINRAKDMEASVPSTLVKFKGKLGVFVSESRYFQDITRSFQLWVLVDAEKHEWSKHLSVVEHPLLKNLFEKRVLHFVGVTREDEIVLSCYVSGAFFVYYYSIDSKTVIEAEIRGMNAIKNGNVHTYIDHVEDVKLMQYGQTSRRSG